MGVGVSRALLDRSPRKIGAAAICVWHSARATTVPMVSFVKFAQTARSLRTIARAVPHVPLDMLVSTACASHAHLHNNHASTRFHVIQSVTGVSHAQTRRCSTLRTDGCQQLVRFVSPVWPARRLPKHISCAKSAHLVSTRRLVSAVAIVRSGKSRMWLSLVLEPRIAQRASTGHIATTMVLLME